MKHLSKRKTKLIVSKFGGTSMASALSIREAANIIKGNSYRRFIVVSAPGKRFETDQKITDLLYRCVDDVNQLGNCNATFSIVAKRFNGIVRDLKLKIKLKSELTKIKQNIVNFASRAYAASRGEFLMAKIMAEVLGYDFIDAAQLICFDQTENLDTEATHKQIAQKLLCCQNGAVIPGFYGAHYDGTIKTFSRGGSDYTASLIAEGVGAGLCENWKDVNGFLVCDPNIVKSPLQIYELSHQQLRELSYMGAYVLHPDSVLPFGKSSVPILIKNTFNPMAKGTIILPYLAKKTKNSVIGIAGKKGFAIIKVKKIMTHKEVGFLKNLLVILDELKILTVHILLGVDEVSVTVCEDYIIANEASFMSKIHLLGDMQCTIEYGITLVSVVGDQIASNQDIFCSFFRVLSQSIITVKTIEMGSGGNILTVCVAEKDFESTISILYDLFFGGAIKMCGI